MENEETKLRYRDEEGNIEVNVIFKGGTLWLTQKEMAKLFHVQVPAVSKQLKNVFESEELLKKSVVSKMEITADDGKSYNTEIYHLNAILAVGYRIDSKKATAFRKWAVKSLKEYKLKAHKQKAENQNKTKITILEKVFLIACIIVLIQLFFKLAFYE